MTAFFDAAAITWDTKQQRIAQAKAIAEIIAVSIPLNKTMNGLEFGSGTGLLGFNLIDKLGQITFGDTSTGMLAQVEAKIKSAGHKNAQLLDLTTTSIDSKYDLIFSSMVLHHIDNHQTTIKELIRTLTPNGYLCICDLDKEDGSFHSKETVPHHGFERTEIMLFLQANKMELVTSCTGFINKKIIHGKAVDFPVFVIIAQRGY